MLARRRRRAVDLVIADPHAHDRPQLRKAPDILGRDRVPHDHQPVDLGAILRVELEQGLFGAPNDAHLGAEDLVLEAEIRDLTVFGVEHGDGHRGLYLLIAQP